ncbi:MAG TPA: hypothetical protein VLI06_20215 [Solimonas sp.]|nr:hypothetical protein [Solimonas sp.]
MKSLYLCLAPALLLAACNGGPEPVAAQPEPQGREETRNIRNTESIGYSGNAIADKVDGTLDTSDQRKGQLDQALDAQQQ